MTRGNGTMNRFPTATIEAKEASAGKLAASLGLIQGIAAFAEKHPSLRILKQNTMKDCQHLKDGGAVLVFHFTPEQFHSGGLYVDRYSTTYGITVEARMKEALGQHIESLGRPWISSQWQEVLANNCIITHSTTPENTIEMKVKLSDWLVYELTQHVPDLKAARA